MKRSTCSVSLAVTGLLLTPAVAVSQPTDSLRYSGWSAPVNVGPLVNSASNDFGPAISKDGLSLYFTSNTAEGFGGEDIWVSQRASRDDPWGPPINLGPNVNSSFNERVPSFSRDGHLMFFGSNRSGGSGNFDLWVTRRQHTHDDFGWEPPLNMGAGVNSAAADAASSFFESEEMGTPELYFTSDRPGAGSFDTYISAQGVDGLFGPAVIVPGLNSPQRDAHPSIRHDGREILFDSDRPGSVGGLDVWASTRTRTLDGWSPPANLGAAVNGAFNDIHPYLASDGETLFFSSNRPGGVGGFDLYMTTRIRVRMKHDAEDDDDERP